MDKRRPSYGPHIVFLPFPAQGHVKPLLILAQLLTRAGFGATFVNSHHNQARLQSSTGVAALYDRFPNFRFSSIPDGLLAEHPRNGARRMEVIYSTTAVMKPAFRRLLVNLREEHGRLCVVADVFMSFAVDLGVELAIPVIPFQTFGATPTWVYLHLSMLVEDGEVPFQGDLDMEKPITSIPGLEGILRRQDLPAACRCNEADDPYLQFLIKEMATMRRASRIIINTFEELESPTISKLGTLVPRVYSVGPLHGLVETIDDRESSSPSAIGMLRREDRSCLTWLDTKPPRSVLYVSLGSWAGLSLPQLWELWHGLVNSEKLFLWVIRTDLILGECGLGRAPQELEMATRERGCIVEWAPQEEVLRHPATGGFLTQAGWNSTVESILAGVPMVCWSQLAEQAVNARCVGEMWKIGIDLKGACDRSTIGKAVRDLMEEKTEDFKTRSNMAEISTMARNSVNPGGTSYGNLVDLIEYLRDMGSG